MGKPMYYLVKQAVLDRSVEIYDAAKAQRMRDMPGMFDPSFGLMNVHPIHRIAYFRAAQTQLEAEGKDAGPKIPDITCGDYWAKTVKRAQFNYKVVP